MLDLCAGGGEIGAQALNVSLGSSVLVAEPFKIGSEAVSLNCKLLGGGALLGELSDQLSTLISSGIEVGIRPIPFGCNLSQLAVELLGRLGGGSNQVVVAGLAASKLIAQARDLILGRLQNQTCLLQLNLKSSQALPPLRGGHAQTLQFVAQFSVLLHERCFAPVAGLGHVGGESRYQRFLLRHGRMDGLELHLQLKNHLVLGLGNAEQSIFDTW